MAVILLALRARLASANLIIGALAAMICLTGAVSTSVAKRAPFAGGESGMTGRSYSSLEVAFLKWRFALPDNAAPSAKQCIKANQHGRVWFLAVDEHPLQGIYTRYCAIPAGRDIVVGAPAIDCSTVEEPPFYSGAPEGLERCAREDWRINAPSSALWLDGVSIRSAAHLVDTPVFAFTLPSRDNVLEVKGMTAGQAAAMATPAVIAPLSRGQHELVAELDYKGLGPERTVYHLRIH